MDVLEYIKKMQEMYGDDVITTADKINRPDPKPIVKEIEIFNEFNRRNPKADGGQLVAPSVDGSRPGYQGPGKGNPGVPKQYKTKMSQLYTPKIRKKILDTRKKLFQETPVGKRLQWIANNGQNYDSPLEMKKAYEKHFKHKIGSKADALFYTVKGGVGVSVDFGVGNLEVLNKRLYLDQIDNLTNPGKQKRGVFSFTKGFSEDEIFKASIIQNNPKVKKKFIDLFADINKNAGTYAELGPEEMVLKLKSKGGYLLDGYEKGGFDFLFSYPRPGDSSQTIGGVHRGITRNTLINAGIPVEHIKSFQLVRKPLESIEKILRKVSTNPNYAKKVWGVGSGTSQKIANQLNNFLEGQKEAKKIVRDLDTMFIKGQMNKEGYKGTVDSYLKTDAGKASSYNFTKVFGGVQFDHTLAKSIGRDYKYLPRNYLLKGQFTTGKFNRIKKDIFDLPLIEMLKKHKEGKISGTKIKEFIDDFNKKTGGYAEFTFDEKKGKIAYPQEKKVVYDLSRYSNPGEVAKELEKNIKMTMSDEFQKGYKGIISKEDLKSFKTVGAKNILNNIQANSKLPECRLDSAEGGRIGFAYSNKCIKDGLEETKKKAAAGDKKAARQLVKTAEAASKGGRLLKNILGPGAILGEALFEGAIIGNKVLGGKPLKQAWAESYLSYLDPRKYRGELDPLLLERNRMLESTADKNILQSGFDAQDRISAFNKARDEEFLAKQRGRIDQLMTEAEREKQRAYEKQSSPFIKDSQLQKDADIISAEAFKDASNIAQEYLQGQTGANIAKYRTDDFGRFESGRDRAVRKKRMQEMFTEMPRDFLTATTSDLLNYTQQLKELGFDVSTKDLMAEQDMLRSMPLSKSAEMYGPEQVYGTQGRFAGGGRAGLSGGDTSGRPPESGPMSQGLRSLYNNGRKL